MTSIENAKEAVEHQIEIIPELPSDNPDLSDACLIDDGTAEPFDILGDDEKGDFDESCDSADSGEDVEIHLGEINVPQNDKQDSGIDDKDSSPPTNPASPTEPKAEISMVYDIRVKESKSGKNQSQRAKSKPSTPRIKRIARIRENEKKRANQTVKQLKQDIHHGYHGQKRPVIHNNWNQKARGGKSSFRRSAPSGNQAVPRRQPGGSVTHQWGQPRRLSQRGSPPKAINQKRTSPKGPRRRSTLNTTWQNNSQTSFGSNSPKTKNQKKNHHQKKKPTKKRHLSLEEDFENLRVTVSPGKGNKREVNSAAQEEKKIAGEVLMGLINPNAKSPKSKASQTILGLLNPQQKSSRRTTLDTTWMTNTSPNKSLEELFKNASPPNQAKFHPKVRRSTLNTTWQAVDEKENRPSKSPNNKKDLTLSEKFGKIQNERPTKFAEWKKRAPRRSTLDTTWQD